MFSRAIPSCHPKVTHTPSNVTVAVTQRHQSSASYVQEDELLGLSVRQIRTEVGVTDSHFRMNLGFSELTFMTSNASLSGWTVVVVHSSFIDQ